MRTLLFSVTLGICILFTLPVLSTKTSQSDLPSLAEAAIETTYSLTKDTEKSHSTQSADNERLIKYKQFIAERAVANGESDTNKPPLGASIPAANSADSLALVDLYNSTNGSSWTYKTNWLTGRVSKWYGISVSSSTGRVTGINLNGNNLVGTIPSSIVNLAYLVTLNLHDNTLTGSLPSNLGNLTNLMIIYLQNNQLSGSFPSTISTLTNLYDLDISNNSFSGDFPSGISGTSLISANLSSNQFTGNILSALSTNTYLNELDISDNQFSGIAPSSAIGDVSGYFTKLHIQNNEFTFLDLEPILNWSNYADFSSDYTYSPQANVGLADTISVYMTESVHISIAGYEPSANDAFQWYQSSNLLTGENDSIFEIASAARSNGGNYNCQITNNVITGLTLSSEVVLVNIKNHIPVANAGSNQNANENVLVQLNGSASSDGDTDPLTYQWTAPLGITLSSSTIYNPTFTTPEVASNTDYPFLLKVYDGYDYSPYDTVIITVKQVNRVPVADAGSHQSVNENTLVTLDGSASSDGDGDPLTFSWRPQSGITLSDTTAEKPTFTAPNITKDTIYYFSLVVNDGIAASTRDTVAITVKLVNQLPVANAGADQTVTEGDLVTLDGSASSDADGHPITYLWTAPAAITLSSTTATGPTFTAPSVSVDTEYKITLVVNDGYDNSVRDTISVTVQNSAATPETLSVQTVTLTSGQTKCYDAVQYITVAGSGTVGFESGSSAELIAGVKIDFEPGFHAYSGSYMYAHISSTFCTKSAELTQPYQDQASSDKIRGIKVYPNPSNGMITVELANFEQVAAISVYNLRGSRVYTTSSQTSVELNLSQVEKGFYIVQVVGDNTVSAQKIMIR